MPCRSSIGAALLAALVAGCSGNDAHAPQARAAAPNEAGPMDAELQSIVRAALADAARRTGRAPAALKVASAEAVTWADGSLGCPQPDRMYTMALVPGYRIRIRAGAEVLDYHASRRGELVLCPPGRSQQPPANRSPVDR